jgi:hypothetical protein
MKQYQEPTEHLNQLILGLLIEELETPEIDLGERLVRALTKLASVRLDETIPSIVQKALESSGRTARRLLMVISCLANRIPESLAAHQQTIAQLLDRNDFFCRQTALRILKLVDEALTIDASVANAINEVETAYSSAISYPAYRLPKNPSDAFSAFLRRNTLSDFRRKVATCERILDVPTGSLAAAIEERLLAQGWSIHKEQDCVEDDWYGHVHPQGWPVVWITTGFQERVTEVLWGVLDEATEKFKLTETQIDLMWRTIQAVDPEYVNRGCIARPGDIPPLQVTDKEAWFSELQELESLQVVTASAHSESSDWITVFENRSLAHEEQYNVPYRQYISLTSFLIPLRSYGAKQELDEIDLLTERISFPDSDQAITLAQARRTLMMSGTSISDQASPPSVPLIAQHQNFMTFLGYRYVCLLASFIIDEMALTFENFDLVRDGEKVAVYEAWQEGYQDESYTRDKLSWGVRLRVRRDLLAGICKKYDRLLCTHSYEKREHFSSIYTRDADDTRDSRRYILYHL